jgi:hypothetical protein
MIQSTQVFPSDTVAKLSQGPHAFGYQIMEPPCVDGAARMLTRRGSVASCARRPTLGMLSLQQPDITQLFRNIGSDLVDVRFERKVKNAENIRR